MSYFNSGRGKTCIVDKPRAPQQAEPQSSAAKASEQEAAVCAAQSSTMVGFAVDQTTTPNPHAETGAPPYFAEREIGPPAPEEAARDKGAVAVPKHSEALEDQSKRLSLDQAYDACKAAQALPQGDIVASRWSPRALAMLAPALEFTTAYKAADEAARKQVCERIKQDGGRQRGPHKKNIELIAVHCCVPPADEAQQKAWSRFAKVVMVAAHEGVLPNDAEKFLEDHNLKWCLDKAAEIKGKPRKTQVKKPNILHSLKKFPWITEALVAGKGEAFSSIRPQFEKIEAELCDARRKAYMAKRSARAPSNSNAGAH